MDKVNLIRQLNDGLAHLVELKAGDRLIISWEEDNENCVSFKFYEDNSNSDKNWSELGNSMNGEFTFINVNDYYRSKSGYKLINMFSPNKYLRMGLGTYIVKWFLQSKDDCSHIYASDPFDVNIKDGSEITGDGGYFLNAMQNLNLIQDPNRED